VTTTEGPEVVERRARSAVRLDAQDRQLASSATTESLVNDDLYVDFGRCTPLEVRGDNSCQAERRQSLLRAGQFGRGPPPKLVENGRLDRVGHVGLEFLDVNHEVAFELASAPPVPIEGVLTHPNELPELAELLQTDLFLELTAKALLRAFIALEPASWREPKRVRHAG
jgi:hypothetical protein